MLNDSLQNAIPYVKNGDRGHFTYVLIVWAKRNFVLSTFIFPTFFVRRMYQFILFVIMCTEFGSLGPESRKFWSRLRKNSRMDTEESWAGADISVQSKAEVHLWVGEWTGLRRLFWGVPKTTSFYWGLCTWRCSVLESCVTVSLTSRDWAVYDQLSLPVRLGSSWLLDGQIGAVSLFSTDYRGCESARPCNVSQDILLTSGPKMWSLINI
jgi:hypothetical protein